MHSGPHKGYLTARDVYTTLSSIGVAWVMCQNSSKLFHSVGMEIVVASRTQFCSNGSRRRRDHTHTILSELAGVGRFLEVFQNQIVHMDSL